MAFKMNGMNFGQGTGSAMGMGAGSTDPRLNKPGALTKPGDATMVRKAAKAKKLRERAAELRAKGKDKKAAGKDKKAAKLHKRADSKDIRADVKETMASNIKKGVDKKANLVDPRGGQTPTIKHRVDKPKVHDEEGKKVKGTGKKKSPPVTKSDAGTANKSFRDSFRLARDAGKKEFTWKGKKYHTGTREEAAKKKKTKVLKAAYKDVKEKGDVFFEEQINKLNKEHKKKSALKKNGTGGKTHKDQTHIRRGRTRSTMDHIRRRIAFEKSQNQQKQEVEL